MTTQSQVVHSTFSLERTYPVPPSRVFAAFANQEAKRRWFAEGERWELDEFTVDFRVGGREVARFRFTGGGANGAPMGNDTIFLDIVSDRRIVFAYTMTVREQTDLRLPRHCGIDTGGRRHPSDLHRAGRIPRWWRSAGIAGNGVGQPTGETGKRAWEAGTEIAKCQSCDSRSRCRWTASWPVPGKASTIRSA